MLKLFHGKRPINFLKALHKEIKIMKLFSTILFALLSIFWVEKSSASSVGSVAVFCASSVTKEKYHTLMYNLGAEIAKHGKNLVFGGASAGLMESGG